MPSMLKLPVLSRSAMRRPAAGPSRHGVDEELDRGVDLARAAPDADQQRHRDEHRLPEDEEEDESRAQKTPIMAVSMTSRQIMNSFTRFLM
jgi:hypothetical protein